MTRKERSKVRAREAEPSAVPINALIDDAIVRVIGPAPLPREAFAEAYGMKPVERVTPEDLVERYPEPAEITINPHGEWPPEARRTLMDWLPALPAPVMESGLEHALDEGPYPPALPALTSRVIAADGEPSEAVVQDLIAKLEVSPRVREAIARLMATNAAITESNGGQEPSAFVLEPLWVERLGQMATAAGQSPSQYLQTLLARAWTAMPRRSRGA